MSEIPSGEPGRRQQAFKRNEALEALLTEINSRLAPVELELARQHAEPAQPILLIMGPMRSGTTLFMQWLAASGLCAYPTNFLSRFWRAPILGAKLQVMLTDPRYSFRDELGEFQQQAAYSSENGKTRGVLAPNEFWYFWRRFLPEWSRDVWTDAELEAGVDVSLLRAELAGLVSVFDKPFAAKAMLFNYNIPFLDRALDKALFVHVERDLVANAASVLEARQRQLGSESAWYSFDIPERKTLASLVPEAQVLEQVQAINGAVRRGLSQVAAGRKLHVDYQAFCADPAAVYAALVEKIVAQGGAAERDYRGPRSFERRAVDEVMHARLAPYLKP